MLTGTLAACFIAVIVTGIFACLFRTSVMLVKTPYEILDIERAKHDALSVLSSGSIPDQVNFNNVRINFDNTSDDKNLILLIEKDGFQKIRGSYLVWPNETP
jgi:hypothetical protein